MEAFTLYADETDPQVVNHHHQLFWEEHKWDMQRRGQTHFPAFTRRHALIMVGRIGKEGNQHE